MTRDREPCQLVPIWLMTIPLQHGHTGSVFMVAKLKKDRLSLTLMTHDRESCQLVPIWLMPIHLENGHTGSVFIVAKLKKDRLNLTLMNHDREPCQLVPIWLMPIHLENGHTGSVFIVAKLKKRQAKPNPNYSRSRALSVGPNMANASSFREWSHWQRFYGSQIKKKDRLNLTLMTHDREPCQLVPIWLMTIPLQHFHTGSVFMEAK